jgi:hypothetical protein
VLDKDKPEHIVIYDKSVALKMVAAAGLKVINLYDEPPSDDPSGWSKQDEFVAERA